jgi:DNA-binding response OmpR family regulator
MKGENQRRDPPPVSKGGFTMQNSQAPLILVADDEADIRALLRILLEKDGYRVLEASDGIQTLQALRDHPDVSLILLDIMMPNLDGFETARALRKTTDAPVLFLTARSSDADKSAAYLSGGDDYIVKPFHSIDLRLKVGAMLRRYELYRARGEETAEETDGIIRFTGDVEWRPEEKAIYKLGSPVELTEREYLLFARLAESRGECLTPATLYEEVWGETYLTSSSNTVIVHIANLRRKLEKEPSSPALIRTVWGKGYRID